MSLLDQIEQIICAHHAYLRRVLPEIAEEIQKTAVSREQKTSWDKLCNNFRSLSEELFKHMLKEEVMLFPSILEVERTARDGTPLDLTRHDIKNPLEQMEFEHQVTENFLTEIHDAGEELGWRKNYPALYRRMDELEKDLFRHIQIEEESLFKEARKLYIQVTARFPNKKD